MNSLHSTTYALICSKNTTFQWTQWLTPCTSVFFEILIVLRVVTNFSYILWDLNVTAFTRVLHRSLYWANWIQFSPSQHISVKNSLVLFCHLYCIHSIALDVESCVSGWGHSWDEIMLCSWQNFMWWLFKSVRIWVYCEVSSSMYFNPLRTNLYLWDLKAQFITRS